LKCLNCNIEFGESDIGVMEDWDLQLCDDCEAEVVNNEGGLTEWDLLKKHLITLSIGDNFLTAFSANEIIKKMDSIEQTKN
jgi:hypothetical protein